MPARPAVPPAGSGLAFSAESLRWGMGLFCAFVGAFILVAPHRFGSAPYQALVSFRGPWGIAALATGVALLAVAVTRPRPLARVAAHLLGSATLFSLAASFAFDGAWSGMIAYMILGLATALAGVLPPERVVPRGVPGSDLYALAMAMIAIVNGAVILFVPKLFAAYFALSGPRLSWTGLLLLAGGLLLLVAQIRPDRFSPRLGWLAHLLTGVGFFAYGLDVSLPLRAWTGVVLYGVGGVALAFLPWLARWLERIDTSALRSRVALVLATATSVALVLTAAVATHQEERLASEQVLETRKVEAQAIARHVADWVHLSSARATVIAATAGRVPNDPAAQRAFLQNTIPLYPEIAALVRLDARGRVVAAAGGLPLDALDRLGVTAGVQSDPRVHLRLLQLPEESEPRLVLGAAVAGPDGTPAGSVIGLTPANSLAARIERPESNVHLADGFGNTIAKRDLSPYSSAFGSLPADWDRTILRGEPLPQAGRLVAFATVPDLGWVVAVERPRRAALAGVRQGRDMAFLLLLAVVPITILLGIVAARRIARPLHTLADAVDQMTAGNPAAPLEPSPISEVSRLSAAFAEMRGRLAERTRESERLAGELRARAEALAETDRRKNEFLAMLAHELRNPLGAIANASYVLEKIGVGRDGDSPAQRSVAVIQRQIQHLVRMVDDLLDVSRITRGKVELRKEPLDLRDPVRHAVDTLRPLVEAKEHELRLEILPEPLPMDADVTRLEQVVGNLLRNAAKYTDSGGLIEVSLRRHAQEAVLLVRDNGMGIGPDLLPRVFDLFTQGEQDLDRTNAGLGIGLTLVRSLVEMHGGRVEARSEGEGRGSELEVRLPLTQAT